MRKFLLALGFLTIIPVPVREPVGEKEMAGAMAWFTFVGLLIGAAAAGVYRLTALVSPSLVSDFLPLAFLVLITGNMHGDGLMDVADGLGSGRPAGRILEIMKDSRVGSHGVMAGVLGFLAKFVFLAALAPGTRVAALVLAPALGRWAAVYAAVAYPYVRPGGTGSFTRHTGPRELAVTSAVLLAALVSVERLQGLVLAAVAFCGAYGAGAYVRKRIGGVTGDAMGALIEVVEILALAALLVVQRFWR